MRTVSQIKAYRRNFMLMYLKGVSNMLNKFRAWVEPETQLREAITTARCYVKYVDLLLKEVKADTTFINPQPDVKDECKKSNQ